MWIHEKLLLLKIKRIGYDGFGWLGGHAFLLIGAVLKAQLKLNVKNKMTLTGLLAKPRRVTADG
jgi:hypothetical protein